MLTDCDDAARWSTIHNQRSQPPCTSCSSLIAHRFRGLRSKQRLRAHLLQPASARTCCTTLNSARARNMSSFSGASIQGSLGLMLACPSRVSNLRASSLRGTCVQAACTTYKTNQKHPHTKWIPSKCHPSSIQAVGGGKDTSILRASAAEARAVASGSESSPPLPLRATFLLADRWRKRARSTRRCTSSTGGNFSNRRSTWLYSLESRSLFKYMSITTASSSL